MKKGTKIFEVFEMMTGDIDELMTGLSNPSAVLKYGYHSFIEMKSKRARYERVRALRAIEKQKYFKQVKKGNEIFYKLTNEGWKQKLKNKIILKTEQLSDNKVCIVSFDVPECSRSVRHALRQLLAEANFKQVHRSVWEGRRDIVNELRRLIKALGATEWVHIYIGEKVI